MRLQSIARRIAGRNIVRTKRRQRFVDNKQRYVDKRQALTFAKTDELALFGKAGPKIKVSGDVVAVVGGGEGGGVIVVVKVRIEAIIMNKINFHIVLIP
mgnify:CR=1 FL=1